MRPPLLGYVDRLSGRAGDTLEFKVSSASAAAYHARLVRIVCADPNPAGPGIQEEHVASALEGSYASRVQDFFPGSHVEVRVGDEIALPKCFTVVANIWPTLPGDGAQCIVSLVDANAAPLVSIGLDSQAHLLARIGNDDCIPRWISILPFCALQDLISWSIHLVVQVPVLA